MLAVTLTARATLALAERKWGEAAGFAERAIAAIEATGGKDAPELWDPLAALARAKLGAGHPDEARPFAERALVIGEKAQITEGDLAPVRELLKQVK